MKFTNGNPSRKPWVLFGEQQSRTEVQPVSVWLELRADREESGNDPFRADCPPLSGQVRMQAQPSRQRWKNIRFHQLSAFTL